MSSLQPVTILSLVFYIISHITLTSHAQTVYDKTEYIIVYITSESSIPPNTFNESFATFSTSLESVLYQTLPTISFNITHTNVYCVPYENNIYASFYMQVSFNSNANEIISTITDLLNNDLLSQLILSKISIIDSNSFLLHPNPFIFSTHLITTIENIGFSETNCLSYLIQIENKRSETNANEMDTYINHDDDDIVQFFVYGITFHSSVFLIWSIICICFGISLCTILFCLHIRLTESRHIKRKQKRLMEKRRRHKLKNNNYLEHTPSCITSTHMSMDGQSDLDLNDDVITIITENSAKTNVTEISNSDISNYSNQNRIRSMRISRHKKSKSYSKNDKIKLHSVNKNKYSKIKKGSKYDSIPTNDRYFDDIDEFNLELKQDDNNNGNINIITRQISMEDIMEMEQDEIKYNNNSPRNTLETLKTIQTNNTENKIVTVHVHHHYNPNPNPNPNAPLEYKIENISIQSPINNIEEHKQHEKYPDLPYENVNINNILSVRNSISNKKELSKSQREGFSPYACTKQPLKGVRKSIASQPDDHLSDSELMYAPGPAADDTPHTMGNTHTPFTQTPRDNFNQY